MILFQYQGFAEPVFSGSERTSVDKYDSRIERPDTSFGKVRINACLAVLAAATSLAYSEVVPAIERTTIDKYDSKVEQPVSLWHQKAKDGFRPLIQSSFEAVHVDVSFSTGQLTSILLIQRVAGAFSKTFDCPRTQVTPTVLADSWHPQNPSPNFDSKRWQFEYQIGVLPDQQQIPDLDGWVSAIQLPQFDVRRTQFLHPYFTIDTTLRAERSTPDRWHPEIQRPTFDLRRAQFEYQVGVLPDQQQFPDVDGWVSATQLPQFDVRRTQFLHPYFATGTTLTSGQVSSDMWHPEIQSPLSKWYEKVKIDGFRPLAQSPISYVPINLTFSAGQFTAIVIGRRVVSAGGRTFDCPFIVQAATIFPDRWHPEIQRPTFDLRRAQFEYQVGVLPDQQQFPDLDGWVSATQLPQFDVRRTQFLHPYFTIDTTLRAERTTPDRWHPEIQRPTFDLRRAQFEYQVGVLPDQQQIPDLDGWVSATQLPQFDVRRTQFLHPYFTIDTTLRAERSTPDRWHPEIQRPTFDLRRAQFEYQVGVLPDQQQFPDLDGWVSATQLPQFDVRRTQFLHPYFTIDTTLRAERTTPDRWHPEIQRPTFDLRRAEFEYPNFSLNPLPIVARTVTIDGWFQEASRSNFDLSRRQSGYLVASAPISTIFAERTSVDKYFPGIQQPQFDLRRAQSVLPSWCGGISTTFAERTSVDRYFPGIQPPQFDLRRNQIIFPSISLDPSPFPSPILADRWHPEVIEPRFDLLRKQWLYPFGIIAERQPEPRVDGWLSAPQVPLFDVRRTQFLHPYFTIDTTLRAERSTPDRWHPEIQRPTFDLRRAQFEYQVGVLPDQQQFPNLDGWVSATQLPQFDLRRTQFEYQVGVLPDRQSFPNLDGWAAATLLPSFDVRRTQFLYGSTGVDRTPAPAVVSISQSLEIPLVRRSSIYFLNAGDFVRTAEFLGPDKWTYSQAERFFRVPHAPQVELVGPLTTRFFDANVVWPPVIDFRIDPVRLQYTFQFSAMPERQPESRIDFGAVEIVQPRFDLKRRQFQYPTSVLPDDRPQFLVNGWYSSAEPIILPVQAVYLSLYQPWVPILPPLLQVPATAIVVATSRLAFLVDGNPSASITTGTSAVAVFFD